MNQLTISEKDYIRQNLEQFGPVLAEELQKSLTEKKLIKNADLKNAIGYKVTEEKGWPVLQIWFYDYGRFLEIQAITKKRKTLYSKMAATRAIFGNVQNKKKSKNQMWYTRRTWGLVYHVLIPQVMFDLNNIIAETFNSIPTPNGK